MVATLKLPIVAINFKAYPTAYGQRGLDIARWADSVYREYGGNVRVIVAPPATELKAIVESVEIDVFAQHVDPVNLGARTGYIPLEIVKECGVRGSIINHSEHRLRVNEVAFLTKKARALGLTTLVCADTPEVGAALSILKPDMVAVEPPELIGTGIAVSKARPEVVTNSVKMIRLVNRDVVILTGAGISSGKDVEAAIKLGTSGVLVASAVMKAKDPKSVLKDMVEHAYRAWEEAVREAL